MGVYGAAADPSGAVPVPRPEGGGAAPVGSEHEQLFARLQWLMFVRVLVVTALFGVLVFLRLKGNLPLGPLTTLYPVVVAAYAISALYALVARRMPDLRFFTYLQFGVDALCIGLVLLFTGGQDSAFTWLFVFNILGAGYLLLLRGGLVVATLDTIVYLLCLGAVWLGWLPRVDAFGRPLPPDVGGPLESLEAFSTVAFHVVSFYLLAFLAGSGARKQAETGRALQRTAISLHRLQDMHGRIVQNIDAGLLTVDPRGRITSFNRAAEEITMCRAEDVLGADVRIVLGEVDELLQAGRGEGGALRAGLSREKWVTRSDGRRVYLSVASSELRSPDGRSDGRILVFEDRTRLLLMQEKLEREERLAAVGRLSAGIAHEIRNPLASITGSVQVLRGGGGISEEDDELLAIIEAEADRLNSLVTDFLSLTGEERLRLMPAQVGSVVRETLQLLDRRGHDGIEVVSRVDWDPLIQVDADRMRQVVWNLVNNACQAMPSGGRLGVSLGRAHSHELGEDSGVTIGEPAEEDSLRRPPEAGWDEVLKLVVSDTGPGIPEDALSRVFDPFYTTRSGGTGLGLAIVQRIVQAHGGVITVHTRKGEGTRFAVWLPAPAVSVQVAARDEPPTDGGRRAGEAP